MEEGIRAEDDSWKSVKQELIFNNGSEPETLDPAIMTGVTEHNLALALFEGLCSHDPETLEPRPGVAKRWEVSEDGKTYTFHLRGDAKWSNGDPVTSEDFRWSWYRVMTHIDADYSYLMYDYLAGGKEFQKAHVAAMKNKKEPASYEEFQALVGVQAPEPRVLKVTLQNPTAYFLDLATFETYMPVHRATVEKHGERWTQPETFVGNGPFTLKEWSPRDKIVMVPMEKYWDPQVRQADQDHGAAARRPRRGLQEVRQRRGALDQDRAHGQTRRCEEASRVLRGDLPRQLLLPLQHHARAPQGQARPQGAFARREPQDDHERRDEGGQVPATWFCPAIEQAKYEPPKGFGYDPDQARKLMAEAGWGPGKKKFPKITIFYNKSEDHKKVAEAIAQMWRENLGIEVSLQNSEWKVYLKTVELLDYDVARAGWIGDYGDPMTFLDMWVTAAATTTPAGRTRSTTR